jgi:hypothetical protein
MAKKKIDMTNIFAKTTEAKPEAPEKVKRPKPVSVGLTADELAQVDRAAAELGVTRHAILQVAVRQFLASWDRGERPEISSKIILKVK